MKRQHKMFYLICALLVGVLGAFQACGKSVFNQSPQSAVHTFFGKSLFPETWTCSQCGYENYDGIDTCGVCGQSRYSE